MEISRRDFVATGLIGLARIHAGHAVAADVAATSSAPVPGEDGYKLWLRYALPGDAAGQYRGLIRQILVEGDSATAQIIRQELSSGIAKMLGSTVPVVREGLQSEAVVVGTSANSKLISALGWEADLAKAGTEGFIIRSTTVANHPVIAIASEGEIGALYGAFHFLRLLQTGQPIDRLNIAERPKVQLRLLNHWDNLNGSIERGYAGRSLWQWNDLPDKIDPRYTDYARMPPSESTAP
jgi:alpha-glucuronidase